MAFTIPRVQVPQGRRLRFLWLLGAAVVLVLLGYSSFTTYVKPGEAGVKQIKFGMGKGIEPFVYTTGLHYVGAGETIHRFPMRVQVLDHKATGDVFERLMGKDPKARFTFIQERAEYAELDI